MEEKYSAGLISQSFWFIEFKKIVQLYYNGNNYDEVKRQCIEENLFGAINPYRGKRICGYLLLRLKSMDNRLIDIFVNSDITTQKIITLITIMKTNRLFFEFVYEVYRNKLMISDNSISMTDVNIFFSQKESQSDELFLWNEATKKRFKSTLLNFLIESGLVRWSDEKKKNRSINRVFVSIPLENYLRSTNISILNSITGEN